MATNATRGKVWDNFSSETFKGLESVGPIRYYNPFSGVAADERFGTNDSYNGGELEGRGGPGRLRPASLLSLWATAPYFHNNELGLFNQNPSVEGRLEAFDDGIRKLLWNEKRAPKPGDPYRRPGDLRTDDAPPENAPDAKLRNAKRPAYGDPGYIYRLPNDSEIAFAAPFLRPLIVGILTGYLGRPGGDVAFEFLSWGLWALLFVLFAIAVARARARHVGILVLAVAIVLALILGITGAGGYGGTTAGAIMMLGAPELLSVSALWLWLAVVALGVIGISLLLTSHEWRGLTRIVFSSLTFASLALGIFLHGYLNGRHGGVRIGPIPRGTPVNLLMNIDPDKTNKLPAAVIALVRAMAEIKKQGLTGDAAYEVFRDIAGPPLMAASKVPDFVVDRGHWFGETLFDCTAPGPCVQPADEKASDASKEDLIAFLKTI